MKSKFKRIKLIGNQDKFHEIGKLVEKGKAKYDHFSTGYVYYEILE